MPTADPLTRPVFAIGDARRNLAVYSSVEAAERAIDLSCIERNAYAFYDAEGTILVAEVAHRSWRLRESHDRYRDPEGLRGVLIEFLAGQGVRRVGELPRRLLHLDLPGLVSLAARFARG